MKIAIGTKSPPKVAAIEEAINNCKYFEGIEIEFIPLKVSSDISDMPLSEEENMLGAKNRAHNAKKEIEADFYVGMEGGMTKIQDKAYLFGVVYILDKNGKGHFGFSNRMEVPDLFEKRIYLNGEELGPVLAEITNQEGASNKGGAFDHWSDGIYNRKDQFMIAILSAIPPFFNKYYQK